MSCSHLKDSLCPRIVVPGFVRCILAHVCNVDGNMLRLLAWQDHAQGHGHQLPLSHGLVFGHLGRLWILFVPRRMYI